MTGTKRSSLGLDDRRKRLLIHSWRRGMREMDLILGAFADDRLENLDDSELDQFEALLNENDQDLFKWIISGQELPNEVHKPIIEKILAYCNSIER